MSKAGQLLFAFLTVAIAASAVPLVKPSEQTIEASASGYTVAFSAGPGLRLVDRFGQSAGVAGIGNNTRPKVLSCHGVYRLGFADLGYSCAPATEKLAGLY